MKTVKAIICFSLIVCSLTLNLSRVEKNKKNKAKAYNGDGDWNTGFNCPGILVVTGNNGFDENKRDGIGKFVAPRLETPTTTEERLGWVFDFTRQPPSGNLLKIAVRIGTSNNYYIPFRWLSSDFSYTNPTGYKYLDGWVTNDNKESYHVRLLLPWAATTWYINDDQGKKIASLLNTLRSTHKSTVDNNKSAATTAANSYLTNKPLLDAAKGDAVKLKAERDNQVSKSATLTIEMNGKQDTYKKNQDEITKLEAQLQTLKSAQNELSANLVSLNDQIAQINNNVSAMDGGAKAADLAKTYEANVNKAQTDLTTALNNLKAEAPIRQVEIDACSTAVIALNKDGFTSNLGKIYP